MKSKNELRIELIQKRAELNRKMVMDRSASISNLFFNAFMPQLNTVKNFHLFLPIMNSNEVDSYIIFDKIRNEYPHIKIVLSISDFSTSSMTMVSYDQSTIIKTNKFGIPEPVEGVEVLPRAIDMALVPLLGFDLMGNRIGYGKGFYDRFLSRCAPSCLKIGLSLEPPVEVIPADEFDVRLDFVVTPTKIFNF